MSFPTTAILDTFDRANEGPPMSNWADLIAGLKVVGNVAQSSVAGTSLSFYGARAVTGNVEIYTTVPTKVAAGKSIALMRIDGSLNGYAAYLTTGAPDAWFLFRLAALVGTQIATGSLTFTAGQKFGYERVGNVHHFWHFNGASWVDLGSATDATYGGAADVLCALIDDNVGSINDFGGGETQLRFFLSPG